MADPTRSSATDETRPGRGRTPPPGMPRWLKLTAFTVGALLLIGLVVMLTGLGGEHGPGRHTGSTGAPPVDPAPAQVVPGTGRA